MIFDKCKYIIYPWWHAHHFQVKDDEIGEVIGLVHDEVGAAQDDSATDIAVAHIWTGTKDADYSATSKACQTDAPMATVMVIRSCQDTTKYQVIPDLPPKNKVVVVKSDLLDIEVYRAHSIPRKSVQYLNIQQIGLHHY